MRFLAAIVAVSVLLGAWLVWSDHSLEQRLQPIASGVAGRSVSVDCQSFLGSLVDVQVRDGEVHVDAEGRPAAKLFLTRPTCQQLRGLAEPAPHRQLDCLPSIDWASPDPLPFGSPCYERASETIYAVLILAHESYHTSGVLDEATTNCYAIQAMAWTAVQLGASVREAELAALAMETLEPKQDTGYATSECHAGGTLDLHPETPDFPTEHPIAAPRGAGGPGLFR
jgi:hypothetical protein